jgi:predicted Zn-dependent peptidase
MHTGNFDPYTSPLETKRLIALLTVTASLTVEAQKKYTYEAVPNDPIETRIYKLDNGLTVYLSRNADAPRIQTQVAVRAGSKHDPADATGLAHYLEHMLFKGTSAVGSSDWEKEKVLLQQISDLYEKRRTVTDEVEREEIYAQIDKLSHEAAQYAIPNEYDKMISTLGAKGTNAYTYVEQTVYLNDIPSDELEKWMMVESVRFQELVLRLFHTELETVYEEFNMGQDNDQRNAGKAMMAALFRNHPYGTQTTIGTGEHLKDPSMRKIHEYFSTYYVPNNMAVILAGDLDYDRTIAMVDKHFGSWERKEVPAFKFKPEEPRTTPAVVEVFGPMADWVDVGWRIKGARTEDELLGSMIAGILSNGKAGLIDLDLVQGQKVLNAYAYSSALNDHGRLQLHAQPRQGQTVEQAYRLLLDQIEKVKNGAFDDWLMAAVVNDQKMRRLKSFTESNSARASAMTDAFITGKQWKDVVDLHDRMAKITRQQVMDFAKKNLGMDHVVVYKRSGENKNAYKVTKPKITPVEINRETSSAWRENWDKIPSAEITPMFIDYDTAIAQHTLKNGIPLAHVSNPSNDLFSLMYVLDMGTNNDRSLALAIKYIPYLGTKTYSPADLKKEFFKHGLSMGVNVGEDRVYVSLSGLEKDLPKGVELLEHLLADAQPNEEALKELISDIEKERLDQLKDKRAILFNAMFNHARYGERSPFKDQLSIEEMRAISSKDLIAKIKELTSYEHRVFYYGRRKTDEIAAFLEESHVVPAELKAYPPATEYPELETSGNTVVFVDHDMVQTEMLLVSKSMPFNTEQLPYASLFNEYFGSGLSSIVFQEIREAKALAYSAYCSYTTPGKKEQAHYVRAFIGTQSDKLPDAVNAMLALMNDMPADETQFAGARTSALKGIASDRITRERIYWSWDNARRLGLDHDYRKDNYERIPQITLDDMRKFFEQEIKGRNYTYLVIGKEANIDFAALEKLGAVKKLTKKEVFGYDAVQ